MREQPLGVLHSISSRCLRENATRSWLGMEDAHLKIPMYFLLDGFLHLSYQILRLGYLQRNVGPGLLGCQGEGCGMIMVHAN